MDKFRLKHRIMIVAGVFLVSFCGFLFFRQHQAVLHKEVYSSTYEAAKLPLVWVDMCGRKMNCMRGHLNGTGHDITYDTMTLISYDRQLNFEAGNPGVHILSARYEIRSEDMSQLIEKDDISGMEKNEETVTFGIHLQDLLLEGREYRLVLFLNTEEKGEVSYYSALRYAQNIGLASEMLDIAEDFSLKNFNYDRAKDNTKYMETDGTADDSTLAYTTLKSNMNNLAYKGMRLSPAGEYDRHLCVYDDNTGEVRFRFIASRETSGSGTEFYEVEESFTMRQGTARVYLMNYSRKMREIFSGRNAVSGKRILLGINDEKDLEWMTGGDERYTYFVTVHDLWGYDSRTMKLKNISSFRSSGDLDPNNVFPEHGVHLLKCDDAGNLTFLLYGYMNRGEHEGETGISYMIYDAEKNTVTEKLFIPVKRTFGTIRQGLDELAYLGETNMLYLKIGNNLYAVDVESDSFIVLAVELKDGTYTISKTKQKVAWEEGGDRFGADTISILDMDTGNKQEVRADRGILLKLRGFIGRDLVVSMHDENDMIVKNGRPSEIPANAVEIIDDNLDVLKRYERPGTYITGINVHDGRVNMDLLSKSDDGKYHPDGADTIVSSTEAPDRREGISFYISEDKGKTYFVVLSDDVRNARVKADTETTIACENVVISEITPGSDDRYTSYVEGETAAICDNITAAVEAAYDGMGRVSYLGHTIYNRAGTVSSKFIDDYMDAAEILVEKRENNELFDMTGMSLRAALYYVGKGFPVIAYDNSSQPCIIYYYNREQVSLYYPHSGTRSYLSMEEAETMFDLCGRDFACDYNF